MDGRATVIHIGSGRHKTTRSGPGRCAEKNGAHLENKLKRLLFRTQSTLVQH